MVRHFKSASILLLATSFTSNALYAAGSFEKDAVEVIQQTATCTGIVKDASGEPIIGASVVVTGTTNGTITDLDGKFLLSDVKAGTSLTVSYIGFATQTVKWNGTSLTVTLKEDNKVLDEVVVVGYGTQKKVNLTGSVASVSTDEIKDRVQSNVLSAVQGTVPGVTVISRPGSTPSINFRGRGNLGTSEPLYVIDGAIADATFFSNLDPNSIESISFLKDAASSAIYGSRAAYGVVLVKTKGGKKEKMNVSYSGYVGMKTPTYLPDVLESYEYADLLNEAMYNNNPSGGTNQAYTPEEITKFRDGSDPDHYPNTNWADLVLDKQVLTTQHSLNFSGGSEKVRYFAGVGYLYNDNFVPGVSDNRYNFNVNVQSDLTDWLTLKTDVKYIRNTSDTENGTPWFGNFVLVPSIMVAKQSNGEWGSIAGGKTATLSFINSNPLRALSYDNWSRNATENSLYNLGFDLKPVKGLVVSGQLDYKRYEYKNKSYTANHPAVVDFQTGAEIPGTANTDPNSMEMHWISTDNLMTTLTAKYDLNIGKHALSVLAGTSYEHYNYQRLYQKRTDFPVDGLEDIEVGNEISKSTPGGSSIYESKMLSYFGRITRAAALALRARAALYFGNYEEAEKSAQLVISEGHHSLFRITSLNAAQEMEAQEMEQYIDFDQYASLGISKDKFVKGLFSYENLWLGDNAGPDNPEYILTRQYMADDNNNDWARYTYIRPSQLVSGYSSYEPMQDLVDAYWQIDGKTIPAKISEEQRRKLFSDMWVKYFSKKNTNESGQVTYSSYPTSEFRKIVPTLNIKDIPYMAEFRNRDSRLYASILFPLKGWHETDFGTGFYYQWDPFKAGIDGNESYTGYSYRKMVALTPYKGANSIDDYPVIRYAEVLLTYAEARIQTTGWDESVQSALNDLRDRCGMPDVPVSITSKDEALAFVRNERRIELAAEGHRYDDIRRYGVEYCREVMNGPTYAPCGGYDVQRQEWNTYTVIDKTWGDRLMLMPIPTAAMDVNPLLKDDQNDGY